MSSELRAAAERLRTFCGIEGDKWKLANAYLAEHPADDDEPITEKWLRSMGFAVSGMFYTRLLPPKNEQAAICEFGILHENGEYTASLWQGLPNGEEQTARDDCVELTSVDLKTRGDLRRLLVALGVEAK